MTSIGTEIPSGTDGTHRQACATVSVRGAREHNLQDVDVDIPRDSLVVFTGVSGSGKSSLAFDTIYAEAQRRYFESIAPYARRLLSQVGEPHVREITGLPPAVALQQRRGTPTSRSTVGTLTAVSTTLRMLLSRAGTYPRGAPRLTADEFSPNTATGACPECHGLGETHVVTERSLVPDPSLSIRERAIAAWPGAWQGKNYRDILATLGYDIDRPWSELQQADRDWILFTDEQPVVTVHAEREPHRTHRPYQGMYSSARRYVLRTLAQTKSATQRERALRFVETGPCPACGGAGLRADALAVTFAGRSIAELADLPMTELAELVRPDATRADATAASLLCRDLTARLTTLCQLGLGYLATSRPTPTLAAGEHQRLRLATQVRSGLFGVVYVLDEPSAGLHPADAEPLRTLLDQLVAAGNSVFCVEHDMDLVRHADWLVDLGPGAGEHGGRVLWSGPVSGIAEIEGSQTGPFVLDQRTAWGGRHTPRVTTETLELHGLEHHNLRGLDLALPRGVLSVVTGVSGSGKSSLLAAIAERLRDGNPKEVDRLVSVNQAPIGRTPRSNLATYTGLFDAVRTTFAQTDLARERGFRAGRFSFNVAGGRCETCQGEGFVAVELLFMPGTYGVCPTCSGARYEPSTLEVTWNGLTIADVLALTVEDAARRLEPIRGVRRALTALSEVGLGYLRLGQPATELSGGEAQRIKLASELQRSQRGHVLYLLDEPGSGLHPADLVVLMRQLHRLVDAGHTVVVVEHDMHVAARADWVIDLGPGAGDAGGRIVAQGIPVQVATCPDSRTAPYLAAALGVGTPVDSA
jgi:excinuclease ABC subunit A